MKRRNLEPRILYPAKLSFRFDREIKRFIAKQKLKEFSTTKPALQQLLKEFLLAEKKKPQLETRKLQMRKLIGKDKDNIQVENHPLTNIISKLACRKRENKCRTLKMHLKIRELQTKIISTIDTHKKEKAIQT